MGAGGWGRGMGMGEGAWVGNLNNKNSAHKTWTKEGVIQPTYVLERCPCME